jgi:uncharacterized DUF497 family protein
VDVEFDPTKDAKNIRDHGISLRRAEDFDFDAANFDIDEPWITAKSVGMLWVFSTPNSTA